MSEWNKCMCCGAEIDDFGTPIRNNESLKQELIEAIDNMYNELFENTNGEVDEMVFKVEVIEAIDKVMK